MKRLLSFDNLPRLLWGLALTALPVTSFRWFPGLGAGTLVRPLALYPLALLIPLLLIQARRKKIQLAQINSFLPLTAFVLFALLATLFGAALAPVPLRGQTYDARAVRAVMTLFIGVAFFVAAAWMNRDEADLRFSVRWIFVGLCLDLAWSALQALTFYTRLLDRETVTHWQLAFSMRELVRENRVSGLAYEPAWLAGQIATIFLPFLIAALLTKYRVSRRSWLEPALLALSALTLLAAYSRGGLLISAFVSLLIVLLFGRDSLRALWVWFVGGFRRRGAGLILRVGAIVVFVGAAAGAFSFLAQKDYFNRLWNSKADSLTEYLVDNYAGARGAYAAGAFGAFEDYPLTGVGLGGSGFYIYAHLPEWALTFVPEIARQLDPSSALYPNPKNLYVRLLAETGLFGLILFLAFFFHLLGDALSLLKQNRAWTRFAAVAAVFAWISVALYNSTQDSFAQPGLWLALGIVAGLAAPQSRREIL
ncbi:MAG: O-antigen ligase family protein [Anaerolineales bacterium]|nr:O-antigen ligase family protein [Anaerolineales bacterium]